LALRITSASVRDRFPGLKSAEAADATSWPTEPARR
jgi:hypothetical protein